MNSYIIIAGASGFIGQKLTPYLHNEGYSIKVISRDTEKAKKLFPDSVEVLSWEEATPENLNKSDQVCMAIINLSGENIGANRWTSTNRSHILDSRLKSVDQLSELANNFRSKPKVWLQASAIGFYGNSVALPTDENGHLGNGFLPYVVDLWEHRARIKLDTSIRLVRMRFGVVLSKKGGFLMEIVNKTTKIAFCPGNGQNLVSWIHIDDLVSAVSFILKNENISGIVNMVSPKASSLIEIINSILKFKSGWLVINMPKKFLKWFFGHSKTEELIISNQNIIPSVLLKAGFQFQFQDINKVMNHNE